MQKTYKLTPPEYISEKTLNKYGISTLTHAQFEQLLYKTSNNTDPETSYGPITINFSFNNITINGLAQPQGHICQQCTHRAANAAHRAKHCLYQLANGNCKNKYVQNRLGKILFPSAQYDEKQRQLLLQEIQDIIRVSSDTKQTVTLGTNLETDLGMDSLDRLLTIQNIENKYHIYLPDTCGFQTIGDIVNYIHKRQSNQR